jgi:hypothetical protein
MVQTTTDELLTYIFDGQPHILAQPMTTWLASSRRFTAFVGTFRDKIRKKLRTTQDTESLLDLRLELETAYLLLQERSLSLVYEPEQSERMRGPDFAVTLTTSLTFMVEVTRLRADAQKTSLLGVRVADTICNKLGQLLPQRSNILIIGVETLALTQDELRAVMLQTQQRAERNDPAILQRYRFRDRSDFFRYYQRVSEVLVRETDPQTAEPQFIVWTNPQAKHPLPGKARSVLYHSQADSFRQTDKT